MRDKRALIVRLGAIGDAIMTVPVARELYDQRFEVHWICGKVVQPLLECYPWITLIPVNDQEILIGSAWQRACNIIGLWSKLFFRKYDLCGILYYDKRYRILTLPVRAARKVGLSKGARQTNLIAGRSYSDEYARILFKTEHGYDDRGLHPLRPEKLPPSSLPVKASARRIAIVPGGSSNFHAQQTLRRWPVELYAVLASELRKRDWEIVLLGGPEDLWVRPYFQHIKVIDCLGTLSIPEVISACDTCDAVISHDTGPMHLAGMSRACLVCIFGPSNPGSVIPRRPGVVGLWGGQDLACRPCFEGQSFAPCQFAGCMHQVKPDLVIYHLDQLLEAQSQGILKPWRVVSPVGH